MTLIMSPARLRRYVIVLMGVTALFWLFGLFIFVLNVEALGEPALGPELAETDAIVVLTGGSERIGVGLQLLMAGKAKKLFISGVHTGLVLDNVLGSQNVPKNLRTCCIILGHAAGSTIGNAEETLSWMAIENYHSLRLVTANYHMPRSLLIFHTAMPDIVIIPHPVAPTSVKLASWWSRPGTASLLVTEYDKYLFAIARHLLGTA